MAIAVTDLIQSSSVTDATSYNTASISPTAGALVLAIITSRRVTGTAETPALTGNGLTWEVIASATDGGRRVTMLRAMGPSPSSGAVTIDFNGQTQSFCIWTFEELIGVAPGGTNGSDAIVQSVTDVQGSGTSISGTNLAAFANAADLAFYGVHHIANEGNTVADSWTARGVGGSVSFSDGGVLASFRAISKVNDNTPGTTGISWATSSGWYAVGVEVRTQRPTLNTRSFPLGVEVGMNWQGGLS